MQLGSITLSFNLNMIYNIKKNYTVSILYKRIEKKTFNDFFSFIDPFSFQIWLYIAVCYLSVTSLLCVLVRFTPYEQKNDLANNVAWFLICLLLRKNINTSPRAPSVNHLNTINLH